MYSDVRAGHLSQVAFSYAADLCGLNAIARTRNRSAVLVLSYHGVIPDEYAHHRLRSRNMVTVSEFRSQMIEATRAFTPICASDFRAWRKTGAVLPRNPLLVTFDDGYANNLTYAVPILNEVGVPAIFFVTTGYIGQQRLLWPTEIYLRVYFWPEPTVPLPQGGDVGMPRSHTGRAALAAHIEEDCKHLPVDASTEYVFTLRKLNTTDITATFGEAERTMFAFLTWDDVRKLRKLGFVVGSHTVEHPILSRVPAAQLPHELQRSKLTIEWEIGRECLCFSYPNGGQLDFTPDVVEAVHGAGYEFAFTLKDGLCFASANPLLLDRVWVPGGISLRAFRTRASGIHGASKRFISQRWLSRN